jgi:propionaldehyde dehydrogenase
VLGAITPSTNPPSTIVNNAISIVAAGNSVVFNPHPSAKSVSNEMVRVLNRAIMEAGGPPNLLCSIASPTLDSSQALMKHPDVRLLLVTGGGAVVKLAMTSGKKAVAAGPGNPPVIVDDTAALTNAARSIVDGASFDNNVLCIAEKEIFVFANVADRLKAELARHGAHEVTGRERDVLVETCLDLSDPTHPVGGRDFIGKDALKLLAAAGLSGPPDTRLVMCEVDDLMHPLIQAEQLMPFIPILRVRDLDEALACAKQAEHRFRHTAVMHSENVVSMSRVAREIETTIFVKNAPSYAGLGFGGEGFTTLSIAGPTGEGLTSARTFTRQRRCVLAGSFRIV